MAAAHGWNRIKKQASDFIISEQRALVSFTIILFGNAD